MILTVELTKHFASGIADMANKPFWEKDAPEGASHKTLDRHQKQKAKAMARAAGRPYPNLVDNVRAVKKGK